MAGVTSTGFVPLTLDEIKASLEAAWRFVFGDAINVDPQSLDGQEIGVLSEPFAEVWQGGEAIAQLFNPAGAAGQGLDNLCAMTGTIRNSATRSLVTLALTGVPTTVVAAGKVASVPSTASKFSTIGSATIAAVSAWAGATAYTIGQRRRNGGTQRVYQVITAGTSAGSGGPTSTAADIVDGTVHWRYLGDGTGAIDSPAQATVVGPVQGYSGTITTIDTSVSGWAGVTNVLDAAPGALDEQDPALRRRRIAELGGQGGKSALPALRAKILRVAGVTSCTIFENTSDATVDGVTPHAYEALIEGGDDQDLREAIFAWRPTGIEGVGGVTGTVLDIAGIVRTVKFSRPTPVPLYVKVFITKDPTAYPSDGDEQAKDLIVAIGNLQIVGRDAEGTEVSGWLFPRLDVPGVGLAGVLKMTSPLLVDTANPPITSEVVATPRQKAEYDTSRIVIVSINGTP